MNNKGFTLIELLVTIAIMGIIMGIAFPAVVGLQEKNKEQVYTSYETALKSATKLYVDQYDIDLWANGENKCIKIKYKTLKCEDLIKDFKGSNGEVVDIDNTYVGVTKNDNKYEYEVYLKVKKGSKTVYTTTTTAPSCSNSNPNGSYCS